MCHHAVFVQNSHHLYMRPTTARGIASELISSCRARAGDLATLEVADESAGGGCAVVVAVYDQVNSGAYLETIRPTDRLFDGLVDGGEVPGRTGSAVVFIEVQAAGEDEAVPALAVCQVVIAERRGSAVDLFYGTDGRDVIRREIADLPTPAARRIGALATRRAGGVVAPPPVLLAREVLGALWCFSTLSFVQVFGAPLSVEMVLASDPLKFVNPHDPGQAWDAVARYVRDSVAPVLIGGADIRPHVAWLGVGGLAWILLGQMPRVDELKQMIDVSLDAEAAMRLKVSLRSRSWWPGR